MKILFISSSPLEYSASSNMRNIALLKGFIENGYKVYTLTPEAQKESELYDNSICNIEIEKKYTIPLGAIHSSVTMKKNKKNKLKDIIYKFIKKFKMYDFRSYLAKKEIEIDEQFDLIISSSDPKSSHLIAENLKRKNPNIAKKWIQYWGDPFADDINNKGVVPKFLIKKEEKRIISLADLVIYVSPFTLKKQQKLYPKYQEKMIFIPIPYNEKILYKPVNNKQFTLGYFGDYQSRNRNILPLYNVIKNNKEYNLIISGNSDLILEPKDNIELYRRQTIENVRKMEADVDVLVCICNKKGTQVPGKIYHYAATNKPILVVVDGEYSKDIKKYLDEYERFIICENNSESISAAILEIKNKNKKYEPSKQLSANSISKKIIDYIE